MNQILRHAVLTGLFAILLIPLVVTEQLFFPFITGKGFTFRIIVEIIFALWVILTLRDASVRPKGSALLYALALFVVSLGISTFVSENPTKSFWSNFERMDGWISIIHQFGYFVVLTSMLQTEKMWRAFWNTSIGVSVVLGLYGLFQLSGMLEIHQGGVRVDATFGNATYLAVYMLFHVFLTLLALTSWTKEKWLKAAYAVALILQVAMVFYSATRGAILGLVGGLVLSMLIIAVFGKENMQLRKWSVGIIAVLVIFIGGFFFVKDSTFVREDPVLSRLASISLSEGATRFTIWNMAIQGGLERPIFGWGPESFNYIFNKNYQPSLYGQEPWFDRAHNQFIDWFVAGGIVGFALYLSLFWFALFYLWKKPLPRDDASDQNTFTLTEQALLTGLLAAYAFHNLFVFDNLMSSILFLSVIAYVVVRSGRGEALLRVGTTVTARGTQWAVSGAVALVFVAVFYFANIPGMARAYRLIEAQKPYCVDSQSVEVPCAVNNVANPQSVGQDLNKNFNFFKRAAEDGGGLGRQEAHEQLLQFAVRVRAANVAPLSSDEFKQNTAVLAAQKFDEEIRRVPNDARLRIFFASFLHQLGDFAGAKEQALKALEFSPKKQSIFFELGTIAQDSGNLEEAFDWFKQAHELDPSYGTARSYYAATAIRAGEQETAQTLLMEGFNTLTPDDDFILQAYLDVGDTGKVMAIAEGRVEKNPDDAQKRIQLAAAYLQVGRRADAVASLREAIRLRPDFTTQGEYFISEIEAGRNP